MSYSYREAVLSDVREWIEDNYSIVPFGDAITPVFESREDAIEHLYDTLWTEDSVTGNASGSYTFNRAKAREYVLSDPDTVKEAFDVFEEESRFTDLFFSDEWETMDVIARCYCLYWAVETAIIDLPDEYFKEVY